jgi:hypothetical protein
MVTLTKREEELYFIILQHKRDNVQKLTWNRSDDDFYGLVSLVNKMKWFSLQTDDSITIVYSELP